MFDQKQFQELIDARYINVQKHPTEDLFIYNYSKSCQYEQLWNEITTQCRGLIMDGQGNVVARPFKKFFNWEQHESYEIPKTSFVAYEKMDGCLGILYWDSKGDPYISTRGSFTSDQSKAANKFLQNNEELFLAAKNFDRSLTYCFEVIHPSYRIVVDYGKRKDLVLLGVIDTQTGEDVDFPDTPFTTVKVYDGIKDFKELKDLNIDNSEGFVLRFKDGFRMKIKFEEYCRLHSILTQVSSKTIWRCLRHETDFKEMLENVPDEFYTWVENKKEELIKEFETVEADAHEYLRKVLNKFPDDTVKELRVGTKRREVAMELLKQKKKSRLAFAIFDAKNYDDMIWRKIEPIFETPFLNNEEG